MVFIHIWGDGATISAVNSLLLLHLNRNPVYLTYIFISVSIYRFYHTEMSQPLTQNEAY